MIRPGSPCWKAASSSGCGRRQAVDLDAKGPRTALNAGVGIGHTRWATHARPNETNAHPHASGRVAIVHNGIIENFRELREAMEARGRKFETETDLETIAHLIDEALGKGMKPKDAFKAALDQLRGAFAIAAIIEGEDNLILGGRSRLAAGDRRRRREMFLGSDALAVGPFDATGDRSGRRRLVRPHPHLVRNLRRRRRAGRRAPRSTCRPQALPPRRATIATSCRRRSATNSPTSSAAPSPAISTLTQLKAVLPTREGKKALDFTQFDRIQIVACGTAYYAGFVAKYWFEQLAGVVTDVDVASEFGYREPVLGTRTLAIVVSQSGETADTKAAMESGEVQGRDDGGCRQRSDLVHRTRVRRDPADTGQRRDRRCLDQGVHRAALRAPGDCCCSRSSAQLHHTRAREGNRQRDDRTAASDRRRRSTEQQIITLSPEIAKARDVLDLGRGRTIPSRSKAR